MTRRDRALLCFVALLLTACPDEPAPQSIDATPAVDATPIADAQPMDGGPALDATPDALVDGALEAGPVDATLIADAEVDAAAWRSALYPADWAPAGEDAEGRFLHDFSYAGYHNGPELPPSDSDAPVFEVMLMGPDATAAVQAAIDAASAAGGGIVSLPAGDFRLDDRLYIRASGVVLRGAGADQTRLQFTRVDDMAFAAYLTVGAVPVHGDHLALIADAPARGVTVTVADVGDLRVGDDIALGFEITPEFVEAHGMTGVWGPFNDTWQPFFRREIVGLDVEADPPTITVDVPLRYPLKTRDRASVRRESNLLSEVGVEGISVSTAVPYEAAWANAQANAIAFIGVKDAWMRDIGTFAAPEGYRIRRAPEAHLRSGGIMVRDAKRVTIAHSHLAYPQNRGGGGNGYLYEVRQSSEILVRDSVGLAGRHNFIQNWGFGTSGCVWLRVHSSEGFALVEADSNLGRGAPSEFHHSLAMANLIDHSHFDDGWSANNRGAFSSGAGHSATENVIWNVSGVGNILSFQYGHGYVIGTAPELLVVTALPSLFGEGTAPEDWAEGLGAAATLTPASLYEDQLRRRRGL